MEMEYGMEFTERARELFRLYCWAAEARQRLLDAVTAPVNTAAYATVLSRVTQMQHAAGEALIALLALKAAGEGAGYDAACDALQGPPAADVEGLEIYAWVGKDDRLDGPRDGSYGIKRGIVPAGDIPLVSLHAEKMEGLYAIQREMAKMTGVERLLARFRFDRVMRLAGPGA